MKPAKVSNPTPSHCALTCGLGGSWPARRGSRCLFLFTLNSVLPFTSSLMLCIFPHNIKPFNQKEESKQRGHYHRTLYRFPLQQWLSTKAGFVPQRTCLETGYWHLVNRGHRCCWTCYRAQGSSAQRTPQPQTPMMTRPGSSAFRYLIYCSGVTLDGVCGGSRDSQVLLCLSLQKLNGPKWLLSSMTQN